MENNYWKEYYENNKEKLKEYKKEYNKEYYINNKEKRKDGLKIYKIIYQDQVIYVGKTILTLKRRKGSSNWSIPKEIYKNSSIELIEYTDDVSRERYWIEYYKSIGTILYNRRKGDKGIKNKNKKQHL